MTAQVTDLPEDEEITLAIAKLFEVVKRCAPNKLLSALLPTETHDGYVHINFVPDYEIQETCEFVNDFISLLDKVDNVKAQMRIKVSIYCHIMESDYPYVVLWNLLRLLHQLPCQWTITNQVGQVREYPHQKIAELTRLDTELELSTGEVIGKLWDNHLRNMFNHSQYELVGNSFNGTRNTSPFSRKEKKTFADIDNYYSFEYIDALAGKACHFLSSFVDIYKHYMASFKDGQPHQVQDGVVIWDSERGNWTWNGLQ